MPESDLRTPSETMPPRPTARHFSSTTTRLRLLQHRAQRGERERPERTDR